MLTIIGGVIQLIFLILQTKFEQDKGKKAQKDELLKGWDEAVKSGDTERISNMLVRIKAIDS